MVGIDCQVDGIEAGILVFKVVQVYGLEFLLVIKVGLGVKYGVDQLGW